MQAGPRAGDEAALREEYERYVAAVETPLMNVDEAVAQLVAEAAGKGGGSEVFILSSSDED